MAGTKIKNTFLDWLKSHDSETNWLGLRDQEGLVGIEKKLVSIISETGSMDVTSVYLAFFSLDDPWNES